LLSSFASQAKSSNATDACPDFPAPKSARLQSVAQQMDFNDVPMSIRRFDSSDLPETILAFYRGQWASKEKMNAPIEYPLGKWKVIAALRESCFFTVQVMTDGRGGSTGFLGVSAPPPDKAVVKDEVPMMTGSNVINDIAHRDGGKIGRTVLLSNNFSPDTNATFYRNAYTGQGWQVLNHYRLEKPGSRGDVLVMKNGLREMSVTSVRQGEATQVLLNFVNQP
jgi:hypothetical protein